MFAASFNGDISKWDVSNVFTMADMFRGATSFEQTLCGHAWVYSEADQEGMFENSSGSISETVMCMSASLDRWVDSVAFSPESKDELVQAVTSCLNDIKLDDSKEKNEKSVTFSDPVTLV